jgi:peptidoglycan/xylan/chitin deacetylase (PgdA/CDA1 family)
MTAMVHGFQNLVRSTDALMARLYLSLFRERDGLLAFLFHSLFRNQGEIDRNLLDPLDRTTVDHFRQLIEYYLELGYRFITPNELLAGLPREGKFALLTFDDGYYNNTLAVPVLEEYKVPALFFIATNHVQQQKSYWWDVMYRELKAKGASDGEIYNESLSLKPLRTSEIERKLVERFGSACLTPRTDIDRPMNATELRDFAACKYVHLGNHTADHAILINYTREEMREQVMGCQRALKEMVGYEPTSIAYCNGNHSEEVVQVCREAGLKLGFTIRPKKNALPLDDQSADLMRLNRFVPHSESPIDVQCRTYRSDVLFYSSLRAAYLKLVRGQAA